MDKPDEPMPFVTRDGMIYTIAPTEGFQRAKPYIINFKVGRPELGKIFRQRLILYVLNKDGTVPKTEEKVISISNSTVNVTEEEANVNIL